MLSFPPTTYEKMAYVKAVVKKQSSLPDHLVRLTASYLPIHTDFDLARQSLSFNLLGQVTNLDVRQMIREALISNVCDLKIKRQIFLNLLIARSRIYIIAFEDLLQEISDAGYLVNLDCVDMSYLKLVRLKLDNMTVRYADFSKTLIYGSTFIGSDLSGASFDNARIQLVNMQWAALNGATWNGASLDQINFSGATDFDLEGTKSIGRIKTDDQEMDRPVSNGHYRMVASGRSAPDELIVPDPVTPCCCIVL
jgi:hypothetical protein